VAEKYKEKFVKHKNEFSLPYDPQQHRTTLYL